MSLVSVEAELLSELLDQYGLLARTIDRLPLVQVEGRNDEAWQLLRFQFAGDHGHGPDGTLSLMEALEWSVIQAKAKRQEVDDVVR